MGLPLPATPATSTIQRFSENVEAAMAPAQLETQPLGSTAAWVPLADIEIAAERRKVAEQEQGTLQRWWSDLGTWPLPGGLMSSLFFRDFDRISNECVSRSRFSRVLQDLGMMCGHAELAALCKQ